MMTKVFALFDSKAAVFSTPFFMQNEGTALRSFMDFVNDPQTMVNKHPEDFSLFLVGEFDDASGFLKEVSHQNLGNAASYKKPDFSRGPALDLVKSHFSNHIVPEEVVS